MSLNGIADRWSPPDAISRSHEALELENQKLRAVIQDMRHEMEGLKPTLGLPAVETPSRQEQEWRQQSSSGGEGAAAGVGRGPARETADVLLSREAGGGSGQRGEGGGSPVRGERSPARVEKGSNGHHGGAAAPHPSSSGGASDEKVESLMAENRQLRMDNHKLMGTCVSGYVEQGARMLLSLTQRHLGGLWAMLTGQAHGDQQRAQLAIQQAFALDGGWRWPAPALAEWGSGVGSRGARRRRRGQAGEGESDATDDSRQ